MYLSLGERSDVEIPEKRDHNFLRHAVRIMQEHVGQSYQMDHINSINPGVRGGRSPKHSRVTQERFDGG
jgi:hypothetical protein